MDLFEIEFGHVISLHTSVASGDHFMIENKKDIQLGESIDEEDDANNEDEDEDEDSDDDDI